MWECDLVSPENVHFKLLLRYDFSDKYDVLFILVAIKIGFASYLLT